MRLEKIFVERHQTVFFCFWYSLIGEIQVQFAYFGYIFYVGRGGGFYFSLRAAVFTRNMDKIFQKDYFPVKFPALAENLIVPV